MSGITKIFQINKFSGINEIKWRRPYQGKTTFHLTPKKIYHMLESTKPGFLKKDVYRRARANNQPLDFPASLTDAELLNLEAARLYVVPRSRKRILESERLTRKVTKEAQLVSNFNSFENPGVGKVDLTLANIPNPFGISQVFPSHSSGEGSCAQWLQTWRSPGWPISEMYADSLVAQEEKSPAKQRCECSPG